MRGHRIVFACALAALAVTVEARAGLPDWAKAIAESAPPIPEGSPEWPSRVLYSEVRIEVDPARLRPAGAHENG